METYLFPFHNINNDDLNHLLNHNVLHNFPLDVIDNMIYKPFRYFDNSDAVHNISIDYIVNEPSCNYLFLDTFSTDNSNYLNLFAHNISSIPLHLDSCIDQCINSSSIKYDVLGFCETRLNEAISELYSVEGYDHYSNHKNTQGGGVSIYIRNSFQAKLIPNVSFQFPHIESLFLFISQPQTFIVGMIYRSPNSDSEDFLTSLNDIITTTSSLKKPVYIMGDFNINILDYNDKNSQSLVNLFHSFNFFFQQSISQRG